MTYGFELLELDSTAIGYAEKVHLTMAKKTQSLPMHSAGVAALAPLGWQSIQATLITRSLLMLWQILLLPMDVIYKKLLVYRLLQHHIRPTKQQQGPVWIMYQNAAKLGLLDVV